MTPAGLADCLFDLMHLPSRLLAVAIVITQPAWADTRDVEVIAETLHHFSARTDSMSLHEGGITLIRPKTQPWTAERLRVFSLGRGKDQCEISLELYDQLLERNRSEASAAPLVSTSRKWRVSRSNEERARAFEILDKSPTGEPIKTVAQMSFPVYSPNGNEAFVMFDFQWSMHSALAQYLLSKSAEGWRVHCSQLRFYP